MTSGPDRAAHRHQPSGAPGNELDGPCPAGPYRRRGWAPLVRVRQAAWRLRTPPLWVYVPRSTLEAPATGPARAAVPAVDFHTHVGRWTSASGRWQVRDVGELVANLDAMNIACLVNLDGRWGRELEENLDRYDRAHPGRFATFCHLDWRLLELPDCEGRLVRSLQRSVDAGARGLKVWKDLGLWVRAQGRRVRLDDPRLGPVWAAAGEAGIPVLVHVADPVAFFDPADRHNERLEEMLRYPRSSRHSGGIAEFRRLLDIFECVVSSNPGTSFVAAHACYAENPAYLSSMLQRHPNLSIDISAAANSLGRQPRAARDLALRHPDRVLFGSDTLGFDPDSLRTYFRLLETADEAFPYADERRPWSGRWVIYGLDLPGSVLRHVYRDNARRLLEARPRSAAGSGSHAQPARPVGARGRP